MPYGIAKEHGGDSPKNVAKMERCVDALLDKGHSKESAIRMCKSSIFGGGEGEKKK